MAVKAEDYQKSESDPTYVRDAKSLYINIDVSKVIRGIYELKQEQREAADEISILKSMLKKADYPAAAISLAMKCFEQDTDTRDMTLSKANDILKKLGKPGINLNAGSFANDRVRV